MPGHHQVVGDAVAAVLRVVAADDAELVGLLGQERQVLGDADAGQGRRDGAELAADLGRSVGLGVEGVVVTRPALHPQEDTAGGLLFGIGLAVRGGQALQAEEAGQSQTEGGQAADAQKSPAGKAGAIGRVAGDEIEHGAHSEQGGTEGGGKEPPRRLPIRRG